MTYQIETLIKNIEYDLEALKKALQTSKIIITNQEDENEDELFKGVRF